MGIETLVPQGMTYEINTLIGNFQITKLFTHLSLNTRSLKYIDLKIIRHSIDPSILAPYGRNADILMKR